MAFTETFTLQPLAPFNFDLTAHIFSSGDTQVRTYTNGKFHQVFQLFGFVAFFSISSNTQAREIAEAWGEWKGLAAFYLIVAEVRDIKV